MFEHKQIYIFMTKFANKNRRAYSVLIQQIHDLQRSNQELKVSSLFIIVYSRNKTLLPGVEQISSVCCGMPRWHLYQSCYHRYILSETPIFLQSACIIISCWRKFPQYKVWLQYQPTPVPTLDTTRVQLTISFSSPSNIIATFVCLELPSSVFLWWCKCGALALSQSFHKNQNKNSLHSL